MRTLWILLCSCILFAACSITEPEHPGGAIRIHLIREKENRILIKQAETLSEVECTVWRGTEIVRHTFLEEKESVFSGDITGLAPDSTYSILLLGRVNSSTVVARGYQYDILVEVDVVTEIMVGWFSFQPTLISPEDGVHVETGLPTLEWNSVNGAQIYMLKVDDDIRFLSPELQENALYETIFTPMNSLPLGTYYWKIACRDHLGNTGRWSDTWMFTIE